MDFIIKTVFLLGILTSGCNKIQPKEKCNKDVDGILLLAKDHVCSTCKYITCSSTMMPFTTLVKMTDMDQANSVGGEDQKQSQGLSSLLAYGSVLRLTRYVNRVFKGMKV